MSDQLAGQLGLAVGVRRHIEKADPRALVAAWPVLTHEAAAAGRRCRSTDHVLALTRIAASANQMAVSASVQSWTAGVGGESHLLRLARGLSNLDVPENPHHAGQTLASVLWLTGDGISRRLRDEATAVRIKHRRDPETAYRETWRLIDTSRRIGSAVSLSQTFASDRIAGDGPVALDTAIGRWEITAHRALVQEPSSLLLLVTVTQLNSAALAFEDFTDRAVDLGRLDRDMVDRMARPLRESQRSLDQLAQALTPLAIGFNQVPQPFLDSAQALHQCLQDLHPEEFDAEAARGSVVTFMSTGLSVSGAIRDVLSDQRFRVPARAVARMLANRPEGSGEVAAVDPIAIHRGTTIPMPEACRDVVLPFATQTFDACAALHNASSQFDARATPRPLSVDRIVPRPVYRDLPSTSRGIAISNG